MNKRGQISLDFMLAVLVVLLFSGLFLAFSEQYTKSDRTMSIKDQEKLIAADLGRVLSGIQTIEKMDSFEVRYKIPFIYDSAMRGGQECDITFSKVVGTIEPEDEYHISISYDSIDLGTINSTIMVAYIPNALLSVTPKCGEELVVSGP